MNQFLLEAEVEFINARRQHRPMQSLHQGLAIIWEEFEELKVEVFKKHPDPQRLREELIQIAAMCRAFATELLPQENSNEARGIQAAVCNGCAEGHPKR